MNTTKLKYKSTMMKIGIILLIFVGFMTVLFAVYYRLPTDLLPDPLATVLSSVLYDVAYLASFMLPVAFVPIIFDTKERQPMRLSVKMPPRTLALVCICVSFTFAFSYINSLIVNAIFGESTVEELFNYPPVYMSDSDIILQFITVALVPAFCEEFLFRGVVLSTLMPYGKSTAVVVSAVCFGLMHGNFYQFLYTTVAGLILGAVYVMTDSIWPSTIIHMINNALSIFQIAALERMDENWANLIWLIIEATVMMIGIISFIYFIRRSNKEKTEKGSIFGVPVREELCDENAGFWGDSRIDAKDAVKAFFAPTIVAFLIHSIMSAFLALGVLR